MATRTIMVSAITPALRADARSLAVVGPGPNAIAPGKLAAVRHAQDELVRAETRLRRAERGLRDARIEREGRSWRGEGGGPELERQAGREWDSARDEWLAALALAAEHGVVVEIET